MGAEFVAVECEDLSGMKAVKASRFVGARSEHLARKITVPRAVDGKADGGERGRRVDPPIGADDRCVRLVRFRRG